MSEANFVRRNEDGSIDFNFYRRNARTLRAQAMRESVLPRVSAVVLLAVACVLALTVAFTPGPSDDGDMVASAPTRTIR